MAEYRVKRPLQRPSIHPGEVLREDVPEMALRIGKLIGNGPGLWLKMQQNHDLWRLEQTLRSELKKIETTETAIREHAVS